MVMIITCEGQTAALVLVSSPVHQVETRNTLWPSAQITRRVPFQTCLPGAVAFRGPRKPPGRWPLGRLRRAARAPPRSEGGGGGCGLGRDEGSGAQSQDLRESSQVWRMKPFACGCQNRFGNPFWLDWVQVQTLYFSRASVVVKTVLGSHFGR